MWYNSSNRINNERGSASNTVAPFVQTKGSFRMASSDHTSFDSATEEWRDIPGYEGLYQASSLGRIKRIAGSPRCPHDRVLAHMSHRGYSQVALSKDGKPLTQQVHKLVCAAFLGASGGLHVNHKDGNPANNRIDNLEYVTPSENTQHAYNTGLQPSRKGSGNGQAKITEADVRKIRRRAASGFKYGERKAFAAQMGIAGNTMTNIINNKLWTHVEDEGE